MYPTLRPAIGVDLRSWVGAVLYLPAQMAPAGPV